MIDNRFTRVTDVLSPYSGLEKVDKEILARAADRGTRVHAACEALMMDLGNWSIEEDIQGYLISFEKWWSLGHKVLSIEQRFYCSELLITGQVDVIIETELGAVVLDLKTPQRPSKTWPLQGSAYAYLARKSGYNVQGIQFLQLDKHGEEPTLHIYDDQFEMFKKCLDIYNHFFKKKTPQVA